VLILTTLVLLTVPPGDSLPSLKKCNAPRIPIGVVFSAGTVTFAISDKGQPDSSTIVIHNVAGGTAAGLHSALARQLPRCRFTSGSRHDRYLTAHASFTGSAIAITEIRAADPADSIGLPLNDSLPSAGEVVDQTDRRLEERPDRPYCGPASPQDAVTTERPSAGQFAEGPVVIKYIVLASGKVDEASIEIVASPSPERAKAGRVRITGCPWIPGRIRGVPVAVRITERQER
jgi:hypothetical protein